MWWNRRETLTEIKKWTYKGKGRSIIILSSELNTMNKSFMPTNWHACQTHPALYIIYIVEPILDIVTLSPEAYQTLCFPNPVLLPLTLPLLWELRCTIKYTDLIYVHNWRKLLHIYIYNATVSHSRYIYSAFGQYKCSSQTDGRTKAWCWV